LVDTPGDDVLAARRLRSISPPAMMAAHAAEDWDNYYGSNNYRITGIRRRPMFIPTDHQMIRIKRDGRVRATGLLFQKCLVRAMHHGCAATVWWRRPPHRSR
jgi:hypothetical protein